MKPITNSAAVKAARKSRTIFTTGPAAGLLALTVGNLSAATINTQWNFNDAGSGGTAVATVGGHVGTFLGVNRSANSDGVSGTAGDYALSMPGGGPGTMMDATTPGFMAALNALTGTQSMSITFWQNLNAVSDSTAFWAQSPSVIRGLNAHSPWSDSNAYFDTGGCCVSGVGGHRISGALSPSIGQWELISLTYDNGTKTIYRGTTLIASGSGQVPLMADHTNFYVGNESPTHSLNPNARFDNFTLWNGALTPAEIAVLAVRPVPEPSVTLSLSAALLALTGRRRRAR